MSDWAANVTLAGPRALPHAGSPVQPQTFSPVPAQHHGGGGSGGALPVVPPSAPVPNDEVSQMLSVMHHEIKALNTRIERMRMTLAELEKHGDVIDKDDLKTVADRLQLMEKSQETMVADCKFAEQLCQTMVMKLAQDIQRKEQLLREIDGKYACISEDDGLREHFARKQTELNKGLALAKQRLVEKIRGLLARSQQGLAALKATGAYPSTPGAAHPHQPPPPHPRGRRA